MGALLGHWPTSEGRYQPEAYRAAFGLLFAAASCRSRPQESKLAGCIPERGNTMALKVTKAEVWSATLVDRAGGAADKLEALARAGADLELVFARRTPEQPGSGILFVSPVKGAKATRAAQEAGLAKTDTIHWVRIEGGDKPGLGAKTARALGNAAISFRGLSAIAIGTKFISYIALDSADDAARAVAALKKVA
jgi:hypothetical protein